MSAMAAEAELTQGFCRALPKWSLHLFSLHARITDVNRP
jgi:hypothetical protein